MKSKQRCEYETKRTKSKQNEKGEEEKYVQRM